MGNATHCIGQPDATPVTAVRWWAGWRPLVTVGAANFAGIALGKAIIIPADLLLGDGLAVMAAVAAFGLVGGVVAWGLGVRSVNDRYPYVVDSFVAETCEDARDAIGVGEDARVETLVAGEGSRPFVEAKKRYAVTHLVADAETVRAYQAGLDTVTRESLFGRLVADVSLDRLRDVSYEDERLTLTEDDGSTHRFPADDRPDGAIAMLEDRVRSETERPDDA